ncbi:MAG: hypothetical protein WDM85_12930 [Caulobacteraceae bacterium]
MESSNSAPLGGKVPAYQAKRRARLHRCALEQAICGRDTQHCRGLPATAGTAVDHHPRRIAAEVGDIVPHPFERMDHIHQAANAGILELGRTAQIGQMQEPLGGETMSNRNDDDIAVFRKLTTIVGGAVS